MRIAICDDERIFADRLAALVQSELSKHCCKAEMHIFTDSVEAAHSLECEQFDAVFLDVEMPNLDGMTLAGRIRAIRPDAAIIFVTCHNDMVFQSFHYQPLWFVRKNELEQEIPPVVHTLFKRIVDSTQECTLELVGGICVFPLQDMIYFESYGHCITLHTIDSTKRCKNTLSELEQQLMATPFVRINSGLLVNCVHIRHIAKYSITLINGTSLRVSRSRLKDLKQKFNQYVWGVI